MSIYYVNGNTPYIQDCEQECIMGQYDNIRLVVDHNKRNIFERMRNYHNDNHFTDILRLSQYIQHALNGFHRSQNVVHNNGVVERLS